MSNGGKALRTTAIVTACLLLAALIMFMVVAGGSHGRFAVPNAGEVTLAVVAVAAGTLIATVRSRAWAIAGAAVGICAAVILLQLNTAPLVNTDVWTSGFESLGADLARGLLGLVSLLAGAVCVAAIVMALFSPRHEEPVTN